MLFSYLFYLLCFPFLDYNVLGGEEMRLNYVFSFQVYLKLTSFQFLVVVNDMKVQPWFLLPVDAYYFACSYHQPLLMVLSLFENQRNTEF